MNETSETDLMELMGKTPCHGCFTPEEITELKKGNYIINLNGHSHWCGLIVEEPTVPHLPKSQGGITPTCVWFDSFGFPPPDRIEKLMPTPYIFNPYDIQALPSSSCGFYVVAFLKWMNDKKDKDAFYKAFLSQFSNKLKDNELILATILDAV
jgi:hypothetical protein